MYLKQVMQVCPRCDEAWRVHRTLDGASMLHFSLCFSCMFQSFLPINLSYFSSNQEVEWSENVCHPSIQLEFWSGVGCFACKTSTFAKFLVYPLEVVCRSDQRTFSISALRVETHFDMPRGLRNKLLFHSNSNTTSDHGLQAKRKKISNQWCCLQSNQKKIPT